MSDPQPLNSLGRFRKQSEKLVLEQYSHCEVPAGCGGVILRWRNPFAAFPVIIHCYAPVPATCFVDGKKVGMPGIDLAPGPHVVALHIERVSLSALLLFAAAPFRRTPQNAAPTAPTESPLSVVSAADGTWKFTLDEPGTEEWRSLSFDDRHWHLMIRVPTPRRPFPMNAEHPVVAAMQKLFEKDRQDARVESFARILYDQAVIAEGSKVKNPLAFAWRMNELLVKAAQR
jgi:hypothetical protein